MTINPDILSAATASFAALDLTEENDLIAAIEAELGRLERAVESAFGRQAQIDAELGQLRHPELQGATIADALLAEVPAAEAASTVKLEEELHQERERLRTGVRELRLREETERRKLRDVQALARRKVGDLAAPLTEALLEEVRAASQRVVEGYAGLQAISRTAGSRTTAVLSAKAVAAAAFAARLVDGVSLAVPADIDAALSQLAGKGAAHPFRRIAVAERPSE